LRLVIFSEIYVALFYLQFCIENLWTRTKSTRKKWSYTERCGRIWGTFE